MSEGMPKILRLDAGRVELQAAAGGDAGGQDGDGAKPARFTIRAYTGGELRVEDWSVPVVVDLAGLSWPEPVPVIADHEGRRPLGHGTATKTVRELTLAGVVSVPGPDADRFIASAKAGFPWRASIGASPEADSVTYLRDGERVKVNGRTFRAGPEGLTVVSRAWLREISVLALAADDETDVKVAARRRRNGGIPMPEEHDDDTRGGTAVAGGESNPVARERQRVAQIEASCRTVADVPGAADRVADLRAQAMRDELSLDQLNTELLDLMRQSRSRAPAVRRGFSVEDATPDVLAAAMVLRFAPKVAERRFDERTLEAGHVAARRLPSMMDMIRAALQIDHVEAPTTRFEQIKAAFSNQAMTTALGQAGDKVLLDAYAEAPSSWTGFAAVKSVRNFHEQTGIRPVFGGRMEQVGPDGELKHATLDEQTYAFQLGTFGKVLKITRQDMINDDLGVFTDAAGAMGCLARRGLNDLAVEVILANAGDFFAAGNSNLLTGADSALSNAALAAAVAAMRSQRDDGDNDLDIVPAILLVGPTLETTARSLITSKYIQAEEGEPTGNALAGVAELAVESRVENTSRWSGASTTAWYLFAGPASAPVVVGYLNGVDRPTVEAMGLESSVDTLGFSWRVYFDYGVALADPRAAVKSNGA